MCHGTQKIVELCVHAGHPEPEFVEETGGVGVRFLPRESIAPYQEFSDLDLSARQREILQALAKKRAMPLREIREQLSDPPPDRTLQLELANLKREGFVDSEGRGRGALYRLARRGRGETLRFTEDGLLPPGDYELTFDDLRGSILVEGPGSDHPRWNFLPRFACLGERENHVRLLK